MSHADPFNLNRFVQAQEDVYLEVRDELTRGRKLTHWMWFVFPQLSGLGRSETARFYGLCGRAEAQAYLDHPLLGARLLDCTGLILAHRNTTAEHIFGEIDALKLCSSMTLFARTSRDPVPFVAALAQFFNGREDSRTVALLDG